MPRHHIEKFSGVKIHAENIKNPPGDVRFDDVAMVRVVWKDGREAIVHYDGTIEGRGPSPVAEGVFWHECEEPGCKTRVEFDDEPKCFTHSPDEGSSVLGYSAREKTRWENEDPRFDTSPTNPYYTDSGEE